MVSEIKYGSSAARVQRSANRRQVPSRQSLCSQEATYGTRNDRPAEPPQQYALSWAKTVLLQLDTDCRDAEGYQQVADWFSHAAQRAISITGRVDWCSWYLYWPGIVCQNRAVYFVLTASVFYVVAVLHLMR